LKSRKLGILPYPLVPPGRDFDILFISAISALSAVKLELQVFLFQ
jgi:hypothetical protein